MTVDATKTQEPWIPTDADFGSRLAAVRHRMGWNIKEAARECGLPAATWRLWEIDGALPRNIITIAMAISQRTGCDYLWLVHGPQRGGAPPNGRYVGPRVIARIGHIPEQRETLRPESTRPVRQTRPIGGGSKQAFALTAS